MNHHLRPWIQRGLMIAAMAGLLGGAIGQAPDAAAPAPSPTIPSPQPLTPSPAVVHIIRLNGTVNQVMQDRLKRQVRDALREGASRIVLEIDTWGGDAIAALEMATFIKNIQPPVTAWVNGNAISAGAMISLATDGIVMAQRSSIGDCMPISGSGQSLGAAEREKIETKVREEFRDSARRGGYPMALCIAMVTRGPAVYEIQHQANEEIRYVPSAELAAYGLTSADASAAPVEAPAPPPTDATKTPDDPTESIRKVIEQAMGVPPPPEPVKSEPDKPVTAESAPTVDRPYDSGRWKVLRRVVGENQLLTMSQTEAIELGFAKTIVSSEAELAKYLDVSASQFVVVGANWSEELVSFLTHPLMRGLLTIIMLMGMYSEMQSPGLGLPGAMAVVAFLLLVGAPYLAGLANMIEILVIMLGLVLLAVEVFVLPGFGVAGVSGLVLIFAGLLMTFVPEGRGFAPPNLPGTWDALRNGTLTLLLSMAIACVGFVMMAKYFGALPLLNRLMLAEEQKPMSASYGSTDTDTATLAPVRVGDEGEVVMGLHPTGRAKFGDRPVDVVSPGGWIEVGRRVRVVEVCGNRIVVEEA